MRSLKATSGSAHSARRLRTPHRSNVSSMRASASDGLGAISSGNKTSSGRLPNRSASLPSGTTVTPGKPRAAKRAVSGLKAVATLASRPRSDVRRAMSRAIWGSEPKRDSSPERSRITVSAAVSSTRGENDCAQSSRAACAAVSCKSDRGRSVRSVQGST